MRTSKPVIDRARFDKARRACLDAREALAAALIAASVQYGSDKWAPQKPLDALRARQDRAFARMGKLLEASPRNWASGVPWFWVCLELSYEDAIRPLNEPLSVAPPLAYGATHAMR